MIVTRQIGEWLKAQGSVFDVVIAPLWLVWEVIFNLIDDIYILITAFMSFKTHKDFFSLSLIVGKIFKVAFQWYIEGFIFQDLEIDYTGSIDDDFDI